MPAPVIIHDYDPQWPQRFQALRARVTAALGELVVTIEHVGSTSVPGLAAKPIVNMFTVLRTRDDLPAVIERLAGIGYVHQGDLGIADREAFGRPGEVHDHNLYVGSATSRELQRHLAFRDFLRRDAATARAYADLKRASAARFRDDRNTYTESKTAFIEDVLRRAGR